MERMPTLSRQRRSRTKVWVGISALAIVLALVGVGLWLSSTPGNELPPNVAIAGVDVGGKSIDDARRALERAAARRTSRPITLQAGDETLTATWADLGARAAIDEAIEEARHARGRWSTLVARLGLGDTVDVDLAYASEPAQVASYVDALAKAVEVRPVAASVSIQSGQILVEDAVAGSKLDREAARGILAELPTHAELPVDPIVPRISTADAARARDHAEALLADPPEITYRDRVVELPRALLQRALRFEQNRNAATIDVALDPAVLAPRLHRELADAERPAVDASFAVDGPRVSVVPGRRGSEVAVGKIARALVETPVPAQVPAVFREIEPDLTTSAAKALGIVEKVSEFTTEFPCCAPRVTNIQRAAEILDGTVLLPGQTFSLNEALGKRTRKRGFVAAPQIYAGRLEDAVGGGVSQIATTTYNAAFFAGLELIQHTPHQFYISRYPMGREATVSWGGPELIFRNDWDAGVLMKYTATDTSITVTMYSSKLGRRVTTETGEPYDYVAPRVIREPNPDLPAGTERVVQSGGVRGFSVDYTRKVFQGPKLLRDERFHVEYDPEDTVIEYGTG
jgi:vancomycin resistance protein YoaR